MKAEKAAGILIGLYSILFALLLLAAAAAGLFLRVHMEQGIENDRPLMVMHDPLPFLAMTAVTAAVLFIFGTVLKREADGRGGSGAAGTAGRAMLAAALTAAAAVSLLSIWMVKGLPTNDAGILNRIVNHILAGDLSDLRGAGSGERWYLGIYPFQITYVAAGEGIGRIFGPDRFIVYQLLNVVSILGTTVSLYFIALEMRGSSGGSDSMDAAGRAGDKEVRTTAAWTALLSAGMLFLFLYASHIYNDVWSLAPQTATLLFAVRYLKRRQIHDGIFASVLLSASVFFKSNCYIALVAVEILLVMALFVPGDQDGRGEGRRSAGNARRNVRGTVLLILLMPLLCKGLTGAVSAAYAHRAGMDRMPGGTPAAAYFEMGMREGDHSYGWYNGYNAMVIIESGYDSEAASARAVSDIRESLSYFAQNPKYAVKFCLNKYLSQWLDPTCCSLREYELTARHQEGLQPPVLQDVLFGRLSVLLENQMDVFHMLVYLAAAYYMLAKARDAHRRRQKRKAGKDADMLPASAAAAAGGPGSGADGIDWAEALLILFILGGMLFHQLWEASSRYVLRYYIAMIPLAAAGLDRAFRALTKRR